MLLRKGLLVIFISVFSLINITAQTPVLVKDICPGGCSSFRISSWEQNEFFPLMEESAGKIFFWAANTTTGGYELWQTDGTDGGTSLVEDIYPGIRSSIFTPNYSRRMTKWNDRIYFSADDSVHGKELWVVDGLTSDAEMVYDNVPGPIGGVGMVPYIANNALIYAGPISSNITLFFSDGVVGVPPQSYTLDTTIKYFEGFLQGDNKIFFSAKEATRMVQHLYVSDGTPAGTVELDIDSSTLRDAFFFYYDGYAYYAKSDDIYRTDGTVSGTALVKADLPRGGTSYPGERQRPYIGYNGKILLLADNNDFDYELFISDGTDQGTTLVKSINPLSGGDFRFARTQSSFPRWMTNYRNKIYFAANESFDDSELWVTDGTEAGTQRVIDIYPDSLGSEPAELQTAGAGLIFVATDATHGRELWVTDGTGAGTRCIDLRPGTASSEVQNIFVNGNELYFFATIDPAIGMELYKMQVPLVDTSVDVQEYTVEKEIELYPNPTTDLVYIKSQKSNGSGAIQHITCFDIAGKPVFQQSYKNDNYSAVLDVSMLDRGLFIIEIKLANGNFHHQRLVHLK